LPPSRHRQNEILKLIKGKYEKVPLFLRNSLRQYDCHGFYFLKWIWLGFNFFSIIVVVPFFLLLLIRSLNVANYKIAKDISLYPKVPKDIRENFKPIFVKKPMGYLRKRDWPYILQVLRYGWWRPYFLFRAIWKLAVYSELIDTYAPERIWVTQEMVFESSLITFYLSSFGIKHINFMHGDNYFSIQVAFCTFNEFYVWDKYYIDLFSSLYAGAERYVVFNALDKTDSSYEQKDIVKYYGQDSRSAKRFNKVLDNLLKFSKYRKCELVVRLHPLHRVDYEVKTLMARNIKIEDNAIDLVDSISEAKYICSEFSSVLYIASQLKRSIVIDNTFQDRIDIIKDLDPIFIKKLPHEFLVTS
jgi:hypothetical protein